MRNSTPIHLHPARGCAGHSMRMQLEHADATAHDIRMQLRTACDQVCTACRCNKKRHRDSMETRCAQHAAQRLDMTLICNCAPARAMPTNVRMAYGCTAPAHSILTHTATAHSMQMRLRMACQCKCARHADAIRHGIKK